MTFSRPALLLCLLQVAASAAEISAGQILEARLLSGVGTSFSKPGERMQAELISPVVENGQILVPAGVLLEGRLTSVAKLGFGFRNGRATMAFRFERLVLPDGSAYPVELRLVQVDTARERVDDLGRVNGISPAISVSNALALNCWRLMMVDPTIGAAVWGVKLLFAPAPDPEIYFPAGTEILLRAVSRSPIGVVAAIPLPGLQPEDARLVDRVFESLDSMTVQQKPGGPADRLNIALVGSDEAVRQAFGAAGWSDTDRRDAGSVTRTYYSVVQRQGYASAPMSPLRFDGRPAELAFQKSLNSFSRRHHVRLWQIGTATNGQPIWGGSATEDVQIAFSKKNKAWHHVIDVNIDNERTKLLSDLSYTGCLASVSLLPSPPVALPGIKTDGLVGAGRLTDCPAPKVMAREDAKKKPGLWMRKLRAIGNDILRSNPATIIFTNAHVPPQTFFGRQSPRAQRTAWAEQQAALIVGHAKAPMDVPNPVRTAD